jgi:hypothetical protein
VLCAIWWPDVAHYYISTPSISDETVQSARRTPDDSLLQELAGFTAGYLVAPRFSTDHDLIAAADKILGGEVDIAGLPQRRVTLPFSPDDIDGGPASWQLSFAALTLADVLLRAYQTTHNDRYLLAARDMILGLADYERRAWLPRGLLWNDHAVAARIPILATFWLEYRHHRVYEPAVARTVLEFLARSGDLLVRPAHFTFSTNHGIMQNLALCHLALAFPTLPDALRYRDTAIVRLQEQMAFYIGGEGVVLEHSAGYHKLGLQFLGMALRYLTLMHVDPPRDWLVKYRRALLVYAQLRLPDGSLPSIGDTASGPDPLGPLTSRIGPDGQADALRHEPFWRPHEPYGLFPVSGYSIWWDGLEHWPQPGELSQTVVAWSYFPGHGHKHADELSVSLWAAGQIWWSNLGYWSYDSGGRAQTESWDGSNAPHLVSEPANSRRMARLTSSAWSPGLAAVILERRGPGQFRVHRQVLHLASNIWVVVDHGSGAPQEMMRTIWTTSPKINLAPDKVAGSFTLKPEDSRLLMAVRLLTSRGTTVRQARGSSEPFAGWQVVNGTGAPAAALVIDQPAADSWTILVSCLATDSSAGMLCPDRVESHFGRDDDWLVTLHTGSGPIALLRAGSTIQVKEGRASPRSQSLTLQAAGDVTPDLEALRRAYSDASHYPRFRDLTRYRVRVSFLILLIVVAQETLFMLPTVVKRQPILFRVLSTLGWAVVGGWLVLVYLR